MKSHTTLRTLVIAVVISATCIGIGSSISGKKTRGSVYLDPSLFLDSEESGYDQTSDEMPSSDVKPSAPKSSSSSAKSSSASTQKKSSCGDGLQVGDEKILKAMCIHCTCTEAGVVCAGIPDCVATDDQAPTLVDPSDTSTEDTMGDDLSSPFIGDDSESSVPDIPSFPSSFGEEFEAPTPVNSHFTDMSEFTAEGKAAKFLAEKRVISGFPDGRFRPELPVNRAEAAKMILLARFGAEAIPTSAINDKFTDVPNTEWYTPYVMFASSQNIISGYPNGTFRAGYLVNTAEFLKMITVAFGLPQNQMYSYQDVPFNAWFAPYAGSAAVYNLFPERPFLKLQPDRFLTRGEVAVALSILLGLQ